MGWDNNGTGWDRPSHGMGLGQKRLGWDGTGTEKIYFHGMGWDWDTN